MKAQRFAWALFLLGTAPGWAQSSASHRIEQGTFNVGGGPVPVPASTSHRLTLEAIGDSVDATGLVGPSFGMEAGLVPVYRPPGEVAGFRFSTESLLEWAPEISVGKYNLYRGVIGSWTGYGACHQPGLTATNATVAESPPPGEAWFYLVTAENRIDEEGTKGTDSAGSPRSNPSPCP